MAFLTRPAQSESFLGWGAVITMITIFALGTDSFAAGPPSSKTDSQVDEYQLKATFLYRLTKFVDWPENAFAAPDDPLRVCVWNDAPFAELLRQVIKVSPVFGRPALVLETADVASAKTCHALYFPAAERRRIRTILTPLNTSPILTIGDGEGFALQGCVLDIWTEANRIRFEINTAAVHRSSLRINSKLLTLAGRVVKE
jgi:hypothetical protein